MVCPRSARSTGCSRRPANRTRRCSSLMKSEICGWTISSGPFRPGTACGCPDRRTERELRQSRPLPPPAVGETSHPARQSNVHLDYRGIKTLNNLEEGSHRIPENNLSTVPGRTPSGQKHPGPSNIQNFVGFVQLGGGDLQRHGSSQCGAPPRGTGAGTDQT